MIREGKKWVSYPIQARDVRVGTRLSKPNELHTEGDLVMTVAKAPDGDILLEVQDYDGMYRMKLSPNANLNMWFLEWI